MASDAATTNFVEEFPSMILLDHYCDINEFVTIYFPEKNTVMKLTDIYEFYPEHTIARVTRIREYCEERK
jgi:hypothetical protein